MSAAETGVAASRALDDLYRTHAGEVYRYAYAVLGNHADAEDVTQTTFVNALRALERGETPRKPSNWLITIAHNIVRQRFRHQQARPPEVELDRDVAQESPDSVDPSLEELVRALQRIPESQRAAIVMRELEGRSYGEIAEILELSTGALETLLFRARRSLADELENVVSCDRAELAVSKQLDGRLSRKERRRLEDHIAECPSCARMQISQGKQRRAFKGLALVPLPLSLTLFKGAPSAGAAVGIPTIGAASTAAVGAGVGGGAATGGGFTLGGLLVGGATVKVAAVVTAVSVASGVGYVGTKEVAQHRQHRPPAASRTNPTPSAGTAVPAAASPRTAAVRRAGTSGHRAASPAGAKAQTTKHVKAGRLRPAAARPNRSRPSSHPAKASSRSTRAAAKPAAASPRHRATPAHTKKRAARVSRPTGRPRTSTKTTTPITTGGVHPGKAGGAKPVDAPPSSASAGGNGKKSGQSSP